MSDTIVRPSAKLNKLTYWLAIFLAIVLFSYSKVDTAPRHFIWTLVVPALMFLIALVQHFGKLFTKLTVAQDRLRFETGVLSKTTRNMELSKLQDVRVDQTLGQRILGLGNLSIETAGETSRITIQNIAQPQETADRILEAAGGAGKGPAA